MHGNGRKDWIGPEPVFKTKKWGKESTLFNRVHKQSLGVLGADTSTFYDSSPFVSIFRIFCTLTDAKELGLPSSFFIVTISIKSRLFLKNPLRPIPFSWILHCIHGVSRLFESTHNKIDYVVTTWIFHLIILNRGSLLISVTWLLTAPFL